MRNYLMTWVGSQKRWTKGLNGKTYSVSCRQLACPDSKEGSWRQANEWWKSKEATLDLTPKLHPLQAQLNGLEERLDWAKNHSPQEIEQIKKAIALFSKWDTGQLQFLSYKLGLSPKQLEADIDGTQAKAIWKDRLERQPVKPVEAGATLKELMEQFLAKKRLTTAKAGSSQRNIRNCLRQFLEGIEESPATTINAGFMERYFTALQTKVAEGEISEGTAKNWAAYSRAFVKYLDSLELISLPRNLHSDRFTTSQKEIEVPTMSEVRDWLNKATGRMRLYLLLVLNTGANQVDISAIRRSHLKNGYLIREKREKTKRHKNVPSVSFVLWEETAKLLKKFDTGGDVVLLSDTNHILVDGKGSDYVWVEWDRFRKKHGIKWELRSIRRFSASLLEEHDVFGRYAQYFLCQAPASVAQKHYVKPSQGKFDEAVKWLGEQIIRFDD